MNRREDFAVEKIDRDRERRCDRVARTARTIVLDWRAKGIIAAALSQAPAGDRADLARSLAKAVRLHLVQHLGPVPAASVLARESGEACR